MRREGRELVFVEKEKQMKRESQRKLKLVTKKTTKGGVKRVVVKM